MRKKLTNNTSLKVLSLISAFIIWLVILSIEDPITSRSLTINVEIKGEEELEQRGKTYEVMADQTVTINISGKSTIVNAMKASDFVATADLTQLTIMDTIPISVAALRNPEQITITQQEHTLPINIDDRVEETVKITVTPTGTAAEGFSVAGTSASPNMVIVSGPKAIIEKVGKAEVTSNINGQSESVTQMLTPVIYDKNGDVMTESNVRLNIEEVEATVSIHPTKEVPIKLSTTGTPADGYSVIGIKLSQDNILITGDPKVLENIDEIVLEPIDINGASQSIEETIVLADMLKGGLLDYEGVLLADTEDPDIAYTITIEKHKTSSIELLFSDIQIKNQSEELSYRGDPISLEVTGLESEIKKTSVYNTTASIDVNGLKEGTHEVLLDISFNTDVVLANEVKAKVIIETK